ncbi:MAG: transposase [Firmicutes bacterium]|nr:transposase [Bacillota bacterium]
MKRQTRISLNFLTLLSTFPGSIPSPSIVANIIEGKYVMASPLYRQEQQWARRGAAISRQNTANWVIYAAENWLKPVYDAKHNRCRRNVFAGFKGGR